MVSATFANLCIALLLVNHTTSSVLKGENDVQKQDMTKRDKRQDNKHDCLITLFESLQSCCAVPLLIPREPQQRCTMNNTDTKQGVFHTIRDNVMKLWRTLTSTKKDEVYGNNEIRNNVDLFVNRLTRSDISIGKLATYVEASKCFIECTFVDMKLMNEDKSNIEVNAVRTQFMANLEKLKLLIHSQWFAIVPEVLAKCSNELDQIPVHTILSMQGKTCSTVPGYYMECVRRYLILRCPNDTFYDTSACMEARTRLEKCSPYDPQRSIPGKNQQGQNTGQQSNTQMQQVHTQMTSSSVKQTSSQGHTTTQSQMTTQGQVTQGQITQGHQEHEDDREQHEE